jgi:hypothetical protein
LPTLFDVLRAAKWVTPYLEPEGCQLLQAMISSEENNLFAPIKGEAKVEVHWLIERPAADH